MVAVNSDEKQSLKPEDFGYKNFRGTPVPAPIEKPPFTLKEIRDAIPPHCFIRSTLKSFRYLTVNLLICLGLFYAATFIGYFPAYVSLLLWPTYWFLQGSYMAGLWVIAHECGHQAFSDHKIINDTVGFILHSCLLVPYHSWKITHARHHSHTGSCEDDEVFVPISRRSLEQPRGNYFYEFWVKTIDATFFQNTLYIVFLSLFSWMPAYLVFNFMGPKKYIGKNANHFSPTAVFFSPKQYTEVIVGDIGFFAAVLGLAWISMSYGFTNLMFYYIIPYLIVNTYLVLVTYLQHTDTFVPHFREKEWTWMRGALCTVDRSFGEWLDGVIHHINDTHVCHHLFSQMPFYHAKEATLAMRKVLGPYYLTDSTPIPTALYRIFTCCKFVEDNDVVFYKRSLKQEN